MRSRSKRPIVVTLSGVQSNAGEAPLLGQEEILEFRAVKDAEILLFDLA
jgi:hypothetical protein